MIRAQPHLFVLIGSINFMVKSIYNELDDIDSFLNHMEIRHSAISGPVAVACLLSVVLSIVSFRFLIFHVRYSCG